MKTVAFALLAAAGVEQVAATAKPFSCPGNTNNQCNPSMQSGWDFSQFPTGQLGQFGGFGFSGWSCENDFSKRDSLLGARSFGSTGRSIVGSCTSEKETSPCITADESTGHFSVDTFSISPEFDCRLEFHYGMPDGSTCKHSAQCSSQGTTVKNSQCGGAKSVTIVYPNSGKSSCRTKVHHIGWDCGSNAPPPSHSQPAYTQPAYTPPSQHSKPPHSQPPASGAPSGTDSGSSPADSGLPCPPVLPSCINTWLPLVPHCKSNADASCFCPSKDLVTKVFDCLYANGQNDDDVSAAITFFQGICAGYAGSNPAVATGAETITSIITVTGTPVAAPTDYTTITVATTVTEPCVSAGSTITGSSTTVYVSTAITVPQCLWEGACTMY
ncbi:adhesin protein Mad1 [Trichoderma gamsii]|uniref:Adhesin protein Mad1 n=1 Tax=Trichoderma gamsii TaxID=398673 RepID=A0A2P4ZER3_9HYPO|nr:adhesin protein Mad1 [Trichoderma gamsii]PON22768.1 adhesin protein Mad1 [Trichoderma gamsii]